MMAMTTRRIASASAIAFLFTASMVAAQTPASVRVRATIASVDSGILTVNAPLSDIKEGSYLAITASPQPDGSQKATAILIFPPGVHPPEGFSNWDLPNSTMTNATVASQAAGVDGQTLTVTYKEGEKKVIVPPSAEIITYKKASVADLKQGQKIFVFAAKKLPDGMLEAPNISFGDYGVWR